MFLLPGFNFPYFLFVLEVKNMMHFYTRQTLKKILQNTYRLNSSRSANYSIVHLKNRGLLHVYGKDSPKLLQGLVTNDVQTLNNSETTTMLYSMFLNAQGRCLFDVIIYPYKMNKNPGFLIESDKSQHESLLKYLKMYKLRSKVKFDVNSEKEVYTIFNNSYNDVENTVNDVDNTDKDVLDATFDSNDTSCLYKDTRLQMLGYRLLSDKPTDEVCHILNSKASIQPASITEYRVHRYSNGVSEGEHETSQCIPLEHNVAMVNGVSFSKGCYIGQELIARTHYTGVIRKRIMPLCFKEFKCDVQPGNIIKNSKSKRVGKVIGVEGDKGIGLVRLNEYFNENHVFTVQGGDASGIVEITKPKWWPNDMVY